MVARRRLPFYAIVAASLPVCKPCGTRAAEYLFYHILPRPSIALAKTRLFAAGGLWRTFCRDIDAYSGNIRKAKASARK